MLNSFSLAHFRFELEAVDRLALHPRNPGNTLRGAFGATFKRLVCPTPADCRQTCAMKATCPYGQIFEPSPPPGSDRLSLNQDIPRPFVFRPPNGLETVAGPGEALSFDLILIGRALDYFPYFAVTFRELGDQGIGLGRGRYALARALALREAVACHPFSVTREQAPEGEEVYSSATQLVRPSSFRLTFDDCRRLASERFTGNSLQPTDRGSRTTDNRKRIAVRFLTPTLLKADGRIVERPEFQHLIKRLRDRINALGHFYCDDTLDVDFKAFGERAEAIRTVSCKIRWEDRDRRSWKTGQAHDMGGFVGEVTYEGDFEEFLPLLILGQYTHVGKYAVWGNGQYEVRVI
ncbi:CRISPR system precrRNA processing endoribonuclease RAMP protein Cas6 [Nitrospira tepida]|uniref:CRISPR system precrRNA processing endoribonuclease RAMP protein Cas6 n=1 Tax=Nitrospira tepida TaxID=2973512 RepID=A0AA86T3Q0_9BACT|nr:CRISPR system precrRNA processing endoribonuclease RAMP protein Cas6 [Nitrospira tepida]CAI4031133.1 CRISPR system precrRNA processing endoribonuclease RAMP protein Cas6 [Nitrospira tepida]